LFFLKKTEVKNIVDHFLNSSQIQQEYWFIFFFILSWFISYISFPVIINISNEKNLVAIASERSSHIIKTPTLGGVGIFIGFILPFTLFGAIFKNTQAYLTIGSVMVLFFLGLKDDIIVLSAKTKFFVQFLVVLSIIFSCNLTINNLYGIIGIHQINEFLSVVLTVFVFVLIINAYNLIDGIDGLAGIIAICFLIFSAVIFYFAKNTFMIIVSLTLLGSIIAFLKYNLSKRNKIFMGDTGSMIVGFLLAFLTINILTIKQVIILNATYEINPILMISLLFYPLIDTARIFFIRIFIYKKSPFKADRNHIHHRLLQLNFKHWQVSVYVGIATLILSTLSILIVDLNIHFQLLIILTLGTAFFSLPQLIQKNKNVMLGSLRKGLFVLLSTLALTSVTSCSTKKDLLYFQTGKKNAIVDNRIIDQKIETNDILSIKILSLDIESSRIFNIELLSGNINNGITPEIIKLNGYLVNDEGYITLPVLGQLKVNDKTTKELEVFLSKKLIDEGHLKEPTVTVRLVNSKFTVLGEVRQPGTFTFYEKNLTLLQAIGIAGDLTINGERKDVLLIRYENNTKTINHIDLTNTEWMSSDLFYVKQNDVIVVNPNNAKIKSAGIIGNASTLISVVSLLLTGFLLIKN
jgi:UDP-N-acetylmuramyl pentapeptide phosphotransferase/UDP-N-acetylglucosamine-1-phosphate transferase/protein involved in polysaccharide export with SLBB domain